ncbi:uncharacterized protein LOC119674851 [Teleopsis dalmanni]|uniref:uncharacterized protein LOC119674851 n=1 Tax=Teleopsis dalmanni TaxID=139649 RepID=UPI0018CF3E4A|nr:uncharacterized protein LOC119674851 [Teleopsis dalmanni]
MNNDTIKLKMDSVYGNLAPSLTTIKYWKAEFKRDLTRQHTHRIPSLKRWLQGKRFASNDKGMEWKPEVYFEGFNKSYYLKSNQMLKDRWALWIQLEGDYIEFSSFDPHIPQWRLDPCQIEDTAPDMEDPVRLFHGRVRIVWEHEHQTLNSKLMVTVLGKGEQCRNEKKHQCLKIGDEPILCISKDLVCDGIRHCPNSNEYDSDEDYAMCWKHRRVNDPISTAMESDIFEHFALEVFRNLFAFDAPTMPDKRNRTAVGANSTTLRKVPAKTDNNTINSDGELTDNSNGTKTLKNSTEHAITNVGTGHHRRNSTRLGLNSDLSKYGPWGYLMLGMLLCGGALLICGLWASASQHAANNERESALQNGTSGMPGSHVHPSNNAGPPNYEELDPPPAYSVLFPNQKAASSNTLSSMGATTTAAGAAAAAASSGIAVAAAAVIPPQAEAAVAPVTDSTTTTTITPNITAASAQENVGSAASN